MNGLSFVVAGIPAPQGSLKGFARGGRVILTSDNERLRPWRTSLAHAAADARCEGVTWPLSGAVWLLLEFAMPVPKSAPKRRRLEATKKPDVDKLVRAALDAFTGVLFSDDSQVVGLFAEKHLAYDRPPGVTVTLQWTPEDLSAGRVAS